MNRNIQSPTKSISSSSWTSFVTSNNSGFNVIPAANNNGSTLNASIINMSGTQQSPLQQQSFTATIHTTGAAQNQINSNRYTHRMHSSHQPPPPRNSRISWDGGRKRESRVSQCNPECIVNVTECIAFNLIFFVCSLSFAHIFPHAVISWRWKMMGNVMDNASFWSCIILTRT